MTVFKVGDEVCTISHGDGVVVGFNGSKEYSVDVKCGNVVYKFTAEGFKWSKDKYPSMWLKSTGHPPSVGIEEFKYPLYVTNGCYIVEFTSLTFGTVMANDNGVWRIGYSTNEWIRHTNRGIWTPCEKPKWKPTKPTWCWVWNESEESRIRSLVLPGDNELFYTLPSNGLVYYKHAVPCYINEIPDGWPKDWV